MRCFVIHLVFFTLSLCLAQNVPGPVPSLTALHHGLTEKIGNFSIEILFHTSKVQPKASNLVISPITVWSVLAVTGEGASDNTLTQINHVIRLTNNREMARNEYKNIAKYLQVNTKTVQLANVNSMFLNINSSVQRDFIELAENQYSTKVVALDFTKAELAAASVNRVVSNITHGRIPKLVDSSYFSGASIVLTSAVYFKGQWTLPFNASATVKQPFYNSEGTQIGEVNMMYNKHTFPFAHIPELQARLIELPYGVENRLSMIVMLPLPGVSLETMFYNFGNYTLDKMFNELKVAKEDYSDDEVHCFLPRFKIESDIDMTPILKNRLGLVDLFDPSQARLPYIARTPLFISKMVHKAEIEVTEEGTIGSAVTVAEFSNRFGAIRFEANRPFSYMIIEKITNSIVFGGFYQEPSLF